MLLAPIYRTLQCGAWAWPLFHGKETTDERINILIIKSPTEGDVTLDGKRRKLNPIPNVRDECEHLGRYFRPGMRLGKIEIGKVKVIPTAGDGRSVATQVRDTLEQEGQWHVVHYAGHSWYDHEERVGYVFFPGSGKSVEPVNLGLLSAWLRKAKTRFVFLSSCHSSETGFVFDMANHRIPSIVGFRWAVEDKMAFEYTELFYKELFESEKPILERAFLETRKKIHAKYENNPIWTSPVLVVQSTAQEAKGG
jgi:hypothetical protein